VSPTVNVQQYIDESKCSYVEIKTTDASIRSKYEKIRRFYKKNDSYLSETSNLRWYYQRTPQKNFCLMCNSYYQEAPTDHAHKCSIAFDRAGRDTYCEMCKSDGTDAFNCLHYFDSYHLTKCFMGFTLKNNDRESVQDVRHLPANSCLILPASFYALENTLERLRYIVGAYNFFFYIHTVKDKCNANSMLMQASLECKTMPMVNKIIEFTCPRCCAASNHELLIHFSTIFLLFPENVTNVARSCGHNSYRLVMENVPSYYPLLKMLNERALTGKKNRKTCYFTALDGKDDDFKDDDDLKRDIHQRTFPFIPVTNNQQQAADNGYADIADMILTAYQLHCFWVDTAEFYAEFPINAEISVGIMNEKQLISLCDIKPATLQTIIETQSQQSKKPKKKKSKVAKTLVEVKPLQTHQIEENIVLEVKHPNKQFVQYENADGINTNGKENFKIVQWTPRHVDNSDPYSYRFYVPSLSQDNEQDFVGFLLDYFDRYVVNNVMTCSQAISIIEPAVNDYISNHAKMKQVPVIRGYGKKGTLVSC